MKKIILLIMVLKLFFLHVGLTAAAEITLRSFKPQSNVKEGRYYSDEVQMHKEVKENRFYMKMKIIVPDGCSLRMGDVYVGTTKEVTYFHDAAWKTFEAGPHILTSDRSNDYGNADESPKGQLRFQDEYTILTCKYGVDSSKLSGMFQFVENWDTRYEAYRYVHGISTEQKEKDVRTAVIVDNIKIRQVQGSTPLIIEGTEVARIIKGADVDGNIRLNKEGEPDKYVTVHYNASSGQINWDLKNESAGVYKGVITVSVSPP